MEFSLFDFLTKDDHLNRIDDSYIEELYLLVKKEAAPNICQPEFFIEYRNFVDTFFHYSDAIKCLNAKLDYPALIMCRAAIDSCIWKATIKSHNEGGEYNIDNWIKHGWKNLKKNAIIKGIISEADTLNIEKIRRLGNYSIHLTEQRDKIYEEWDKKFELYGATRDEKIRDQLNSELDGLLENANRNFLDGINVGQVLRDTGDVILKVMLNYFVREKDTYEGEEFIKKLEDGSKLAKKPNL